MGLGVNILMTELHSLFKYAQGSHHSTLLSTRLIILFYFLISIHHSTTAVPSYHAYPLPPSLTPASDTSPEGYQGHLIVKLFGFSSFLIVLVLSEA